MKKGIFLLLAFLMVLGTQAQGLRVAREFGLNMELWALTEDVKYRNNIEDVFSSLSTRVSEDLVSDWSSLAGLPKQESYTVSTFLNLIERYIVEDTLDIVFSDYKVEDRLYVENNLLHQSKSQSNQPLVYVSCLMKTNCPILINTRILLYIRNGKITKITRLDKKIINHHA